MAPEAGSFIQVGSLQQAMGHVRLSVTPPAGVKAHIFPGGRGAVTQDAASLDHRAENKIVVGGSPRLQVPASPSFTSGYTCSTQMFSIMLSLPAKVCALFSILEQERHRVSERIPKRRLSLSVPQHYDYLSPTAFSWNKEDCCLRIGLGNNSPDISPLMNEDQSHHFEGRVSRPARKKEIIVLSVYYNFRLRSLLGFPSNPVGVLVVTPLQLDHVLHS
ncbi:hypothetical protein EYF80_017865 [Liparis tanakae]|uniref:Uncharacterized protein n=1 Tax=Liparis tanakae TaxID=230148 RepID=A0A4Z2I1Q6_9TELE|nr:hypothetical protein EYF80_017865 [Liparis tanakae]